jgi:hypothetical protein
MEDYRPMSTPMITNWKKLSASDIQLVDATAYRQLIGSLMYLVNTRPDICFAVNTLSQYMVELRSVHMVGAKTHLEICCWDSGLWPRLCQGRWSQFGWLHRFRLGRMRC